MVKRVNPEYLSNRDDWDVISLKDGDEVVGAAELRTGEETLCFVTSDGQLLHFGAGQRAPAGPLGRRHRRHQARRRRPGGLVHRARPGRRPWSSRCPAPRSALPGTEAGSVKVTPFAEYPPKGRATGGVRCHRFLKGEDELVFAWAGPAPALAAADSGAPVDLPEPVARRDGSGQPGSQPIAGLRRSRRPRPFRPAPATPDVAG